MTSRRPRGWQAALGGVMVVGALVAIPWLQGGDPIPPWVAAANEATPVALPASPPLLPAVTLSSAATPLRPGDAPAVQPSGDSAHIAALVALEDNRLHTVLQQSSRAFAPSAVQFPGALATVVLPARPAAYTIADLVSLRAATRLSSGGGYLLVDSVLVTANATLVLDAREVPVLKLGSSASGFTSLVTWGGTLTIGSDDPSSPITITGWDDVNNQPAVDGNYGRPYLRAVGGRLDLKNARVSSLGFWSGRTGGVAWTGTGKTPSTGSAVSTNFVGDTYGAFVSRGDRVAFTDDLFEGNELDGLRLHRNATGSVVTGSAAARNGGNGFAVSRGATANVLRGDVAVHNAANGVLLDGRPLVRGASPSGGQSTASTGTIADGNDVRDNGRAGILVEGGAATLVRNNRVCSTTSAIGIRSGAVNSSVVGNEVGCAGQVAISVGPGVTGTTVAGNHLVGARIGIMVRSSPGVRILNNSLTGVTVFGISVRGASPGVVGSGNSVAGLGLAALDVRAGAPPMTLTGTDLAGWTHRGNLTVVGYLRYHPMLTAWLALGIVVFLLSTLARLRRRQQLPYQHALALERPDGEAQWLATAR